MFPHLPGQLVDGADEERVRSPVCGRPKVSERPMHGRIDQALGNGGRLADLESGENLFEPQRRASISTSRRASDGTEFRAYCIHCCTHCWRQLLSSLSLGLLTVPQASAPNFCWAAARGTSPSFSSASRSIRRLSSKLRAMATESAADATSETAANVSEGCPFFGDEVPSIGKGRGIAGTPSRLKRLTSASGIRKWPPLVTSETIAPVSQRMRIAVWVVPNSRAACPVE